MNFGGLKMSYFLGINLAIQQQARHLKSKVLKNMKKIEFFMYNLLEENKKTQHFQTASFSTFSERW